MGRRRRSAGHAHRRTGTGAGQDNDQRAVSAGLHLRQGLRHAEDRVREAEPGHRRQLPAGLQGIRGRRPDGAAAGDHQTASRRGVAGYQPPAPVRRPQDRRRPHALHRQGEGLARPGLLAGNDGARHLRRKTLRPRLRRLDTDRLCERRPGAQGGRRSGELPDDLGRHLRSRQEGKRSGRRQLSGSSTPGRSPATGCGRPSSSLMAAP